MKNLNLNVICREIAPVNITLETQDIIFYLDQKNWETSDAGWCYDNEEKTAKIKYNNPQGDYAVSISFTVKDLISI